MSELALYAVHGTDLSPLPVPEGAADVHALFRDIPDGIYSALRTYGGHRFLWLDAHLERCRNSALRAGWNLDFDFAGLRVALDRAVRVRGAEDSRVRFDLLEAPLAGALGARMVLGVSPHAQVPLSVLRQGVRLGLAPQGLSRNEPVIKFTEWIARRAACLESDPDAYEHLLLDEAGRILEGTSSNFFAFRDGKLITAGDGVLEGITQKVVLELAARRNLPVELRRIPLSELASVEEAFITSSTREIVPVASAAGVQIGRGSLGPLVAELRAEFSAYALANARPAA